ncbi:probable G-protein coupled receptor Mth-like 11 [Drosophila novamexicana]|uniref:probable G-protein coupled receptor Mth-like 11 n=1 Tax=Drosophila novamexicana TaxID=47314 RepID=UPI0011E5977D|nr:probable G-protein coupled receptor Mth-like 11 [Drosophila novamexicana]
MGSLSRALLVLGVFLVQSTADIPGCNYFDTVKLTKEQQLENGSYRYRNVIIPKEKTGIYDYRISLDGKMQMASNYTRGCVCHVKSCVPFCCDPHEFLVDALLNVTLLNGTETEINLRKDFLVQPVYEEFCDLVGLNNSLDHQWTLFENGILFKHTHNHNINKGHYCLVPLAVNDDVYKLGAHYLAESSSTKSTITLPDALRVISIFCMIITIATYLYFPKFRSVYDKCCICYFFCLAVSFTLLWCESLYRESIPFKWMCNFVGYIGYYTVMATFLWLLMINFTLWKKFKNLGIGCNSNFKKYNIIVWSVSAGLLGITLLVAYLFEMDENFDVDNKSQWQPRIGYFSCWIETEDYSAMIYYYGPILLAILINIWLSIVSAMIIYREDQNNCRVWSNAESSNKLAHQANFKLFFRLFAITGVSWLLEIIAFLCSINNFGVTQLIDIITSAQGILLFFVSVLKKEVIKAFNERVEKRKSGNPNDYTIASSNLDS